MVQRFHMLYVVKKDAQSMLKEGDSALAMGHQLRLVDMKDVTSMRRREESIGHGAKVKRCRYEGCTSYARKGGLCSRHGKEDAKKKLSVSGA